MTAAKEFNDPNRLILEHMGAVLNTFYKNGWWYTMVKGYNINSHSSSDPNIIVSTSMSMSERESYAESLEHVESLIHGLVYHIEKQRTS